MKPNLKKSKATIKGDYNKIVALQKINIERLKSVKTNLLIYKWEVDKLTYKVSENERKWLSRIKDVIKDIEEIYKL